MRVLVTGATGKLGPHVVTALLRKGARTCGRWCAAPSGPPSFLPEPSR